MQVEKAINRLVWRFENFEIIRVNKNDFDAMDSLVDFVNSLQNRPFDSNLYFSRLYAYTLLTLLRKYNTTVDNPIIHRKIRELLDTPFERLIAEITEHTNDILRYNLLEKAGCEGSNHPQQFSREKREEVLSNLSNLLTNKTNRAYFYKGAWPQSEIKEGLVRQINSFLNESQESK